MKDGKNLKISTEELIKQRDKLVEEHPELKPLQKKLEGELSKKAGDNPDKRAKVMFEHMLKQYGQEISPALDEMESIKNVINEIKKKKKPNKS